MLWGSKEELKKLCIEGWDEFEGNSPHRPWIDKVKIKHPKTGLIGELESLMWGIHGLMRG